MKVRIFESDFNGDVYKTRYETDAVGITLDHMEDENRIYSLKESVETYHEALRRYYDCVTDDFLYILAKESKVGRFNALEKHYGIWKDLQKRGINFEEHSNEIEFYENEESIFIAYAKVSREEITNIFSLWNLSLLRNAIVCFATDKDIRAIMTSGYDILSNQSKVKDLLLERGCILVELLDACDLGNSLFLYAKRGSKEFINLKSVVRINN